MRAGVPSRPSPVRVASGGQTSERRSASKGSSVRPCVTRHMRRRNGQRSVFDRWFARNAQRRRPGATRRGRAPIVRGRVSSVACRRSAGPHASALARPRCIARANQRSRFGIPGFLRRNVHHAAHASMECARRRLRSLVRPSRATASAAGDAAGPPVSSRRPVHRTAQPPERRHHRPTAISCGNQNQRRSSKS